MLEILIPIIGASLLKRFGAFKEGHERIFIDYVLFFSLPILSFRAGYDIQTSTDIIKISSVAWACILICMLFAFAIAKLLKLNSKEAKTFLLISSFGNTAFLGYPYAYTYFGQEGLQVAIIYDNIGSFLLASSLGVLIASGKPNLKEVILFPPFLGLILGFFMKSFNIPSIILKALDFVALSTLPVILFALGLSISLKEIKKNIKLSLLAVLIKVFLSLFISLVVGAFIDLQGVALKVSVLESVMPPMMFSAVLAIRYNLNPSLAFSAVSLGMVLSFAYVPLLIKVIERLF